MLYVFIVWAIKVLLCFASFHTIILTKKKEKKREKKEKRKPCFRRAMAFCQGFLEKYDPTKEVWRFLQKPVGLDLEKTTRKASREARLSLLYFFIFENSIVFSH